MSEEFLRKVIIDLDGTLIDPISHEIAFLNNSLRVLRSFRAEGLLIVIWTLGSLSRLNAFLHEVDQSDEYLGQWLASQVLIHSESPRSNIVSLKNDGLLSSLGKTDSDYQRWLGEYVRNQVKNPWLVGAGTIIDDDTHLQQVGQEVGFLYLHPSELERITGMLLRKRIVEHYEKRP